MLAKGDAPGFFLHGSSKTSKVIPGTGKSPWNGGLYSHGAENLRSEILGSLHMPTTTIKYYNSWTYFDFERRYLMEI